MSVKKTTKRINSGIFFHQYDYILKLTKTKKFGDNQAAVLRTIIQDHIDKHDKK